MKKYQKYFLISLLLSLSFYSCDENSHIVQPYEPEFDYHDGNALWSADGSKMIFHNNDSSFYGNRYIVDIKDFKATNKRKISDNSFFQITPEGDGAYYSIYPYGIFKRKLITCRFKKAF